MANKPWFPFAVFCAGLLLFVPFLGHVHLFDWDEINFAECAREMIVTHDYSTVKIGFLPFWEKPPLFIWMQALCMNIFGIGEFAARLPDALCGAFTLAAVFYLGRKIYDARFGLVWMLAFAGSVLPAFYFHSGIIDPWFNLFIFLGVYQFIVYANDFPSPSTSKLLNGRIILSALFIALAVLTKGPVALLVFGLCFVIARFRARKPIMSWKHLGLYAAVSLLIPGVWFAMLALNGKGNLIVEFLLYQVRLFSTQDAGHGGSFFYHWIVLLIGCFPASVFAITGLTRKADDTPFELFFLKWMRTLFWVVLILFSIVQTKIIHYSSLCYFPLTFLAAYALRKFESGSLRMKKWTLPALFLSGMIYAAAFFVLPYIDSFKHALLDSGMVKDRFAAGNLAATGHWNGSEWITGVILLAGLVMAVLLFRRNNFQKAVTVLFVSSAVCLFTAAAFFAPRVEEYSQDAAIRYWERHA
ncbi:MAG TPA: glycosyltransferase family 39 protein, partial [Bacteroidia bacterium]|nr:glycosyltransferase family 39 protein [Bacteroidia bacterium]